MWSGTNPAWIEMTEGDWGVALPFTVAGATLGESDVLKFTFKDKANGETVLVKEYGSIVRNTVALELTETESELFTPGVYHYTLDWYQDGSFLCCVVSDGILKVVDKV